MMMIMINGLIIDSCSILHMSRFTTNSGNSDSKGYNIGFSIKGLTSTTKACGVVRYNTVVFKDVDIFGSTTYSTKNSIESTT